MGLKSLLMVMLIFGALNTSTAIIFSFFILVFSLIFIIGRDFFLRHSYLFIFSILGTVIASAIISMILSVNFPIWHENNKKLIFILHLIPICLLEYREFQRKFIFGKIRIFAEVIIFVGILKELIAYGSIMGFELLKGYEGILFFDKPCGTIFIAAISLAVFEKIGDKK
jgi:hypothetical protein